MIQFAQPALLWLLLMPPLVALWRGARGREAAVEFSSSEVARAVARETRGRPGRWLSLLRILVAELLVLGLARPQWVSGHSEIQASGIDLMLAVDVSGSMEALDFRMGGRQVNRLEVVKSVVAEFVDDRENDRLGLVVFSGAPYLVSPLTLDHDWLKQNLERIRTGMVEDGTAIGSALAMSVNRLRDQPAKSRIVVLLTDGMNNAGKVAPLTAAEAAKAMGIKVYTIAAGTRGEAPIPRRNQLGQVVDIVNARVDVDEDTLRKIAEDTGGKFFRATDTDSLKQIYAEIDRMEKTTRKLRKYENRREMFAVAIIPALALLAAGAGLDQTRYRRLP